MPTQVWVIDTNVPVSAAQMTPEAVATLPDPDDNVFVATAMATSDKILVTGKGAHFPAQLCVPVHILTPAEALQRLA